MKLLTSSQARGMAETMWGRGGTHSDRTNRTGAFAFSCAGHGGFIIDARTLSKEEYDAIAKYERPHKAAHFLNDNGKIVAFWNEEKVRSTRVPFGAIRVDFEYFVLEEDCAWSLMVMFTDIRTKFMLEKLGNEAVEQQAKDAFWNWYDENSPRVQHRQKAEQARKEKNPDLIVAASSQGDGFTKVWTADDKEYLVRDYGNARDDFGTPWLSNCVVIETLA